MKKLILFFIVVLVPSYSWAVCGGKNYGDISMTKLPEKIQVARYHSLVAVPDTIPECLRVTAVTDQGEIMAVEHKTYPVFGVQFHPESIMTPEGAQILRNFLQLQTG